MFDNFRAFLHSMLNPLQVFLASIGLGFPELATLFILLLTVTSLCWRNIFVKAGFRSLHGYLMFIPVVNIFIFFRFAFGKWPIEQQSQKQDAPAVITARAYSLEAESGQSQ